MIKIKALNDEPNESDNSDSEYQITREVEEESLNQQYLNALKAASDGNTEEAIRLLEKLKNELEVDIPKVKDANLLRRLKYLAYKNLGLLSDDINLILDALDIDGSDYNLWITAGKKARNNLDIFLSKLCFESAYKFNQNNYSVINNLIDIYFLQNDLYSCVNMCLRALELDDEFVKAKIMLNECIRLMPPMLKEMQDYLSYVSYEYGGDFYLDESEAEYYHQMLDQLSDIKRKRLRSDDSETMDANKRKYRKLMLILDKSQQKTFAYVGQQILALYHQIRNDFLNICSPITLVVENNKNVADKFDEETVRELSTSMAPEVSSSVPSAPGNLDSNEVKEGDFFHLKSNELTRLLKSNAALLEFVDKRRSTRVKSTRTAKSRDLDDDQSVLENLMELLPKNIKIDEVMKLDSVERENSSNSGSIPSAETKQNNSKANNEAELLEKYIARLQIIFEDKKTANIFYLFETYLSELSTIKKISIPSVFMDIYQIYREEHNLPCSLLCEIEQNISIDMILVCLTANEIKYNRNETLFLIQILAKLSEKMPSEEYQHFVIRLLVLCGNKELNNDYLEYAMDLCGESPKFANIFHITPTSLCEQSTAGKDEPRSLLQVIASNNLLITADYINTILEMQSVSISKLSDEKNYTEIIKLLFTKSESDLTLDEKNDLCEAIVSAQMWQKGIEMFENWSQLNEQHLQALYECVHTGKRARLTGKLLSKIVKFAVAGKSTLPWSILFWSFVTGEPQTNWPLAKFCRLAHSVLGRKGICTAQNGKFLLSALRVFVEQDLEEDAIECFMCLFNFPLRKNSTHTSPHIELQWSHCKNLYDYFAPEEMPEFDSHARNAISQESKDLFLKILLLSPEDDKMLKYRQNISNYVNMGQKLLEQPQTSEEVEEEKDAAKDDDLQDDRSSNIRSTIYYLLADFHFKARDFSKAKEYYMSDLALNVNRFDAWAGLALSINYQLDQMIIEGNNLNTPLFAQTAFSVIQCFERALQIQPNSGKLWIEFGLLTYNISSNLSRIQRLAKLDNHANSVTLPFDYHKMLDKSRRCFETAQSIESEDQELWLTYYMLGKVSEKKSANLIVTLDYYMLADLCLYNDGAAYPKKINYYNPSYLSVEALEIHYRIHACILKYLVYNRKFSARMLRQLKLYLIRATRSPFAKRNIASSGGGSGGGGGANASSANASTSQSGRERKQSGAKQQNAHGSGEPPISAEEMQIGELMDDLVSLVSERETKFDVNRSREELIGRCVNGVKRCLSRYAAHYKSYHLLASYYDHIGQNVLAKAILFGGPQNKQFPQLLIDNESGKPSTTTNYISGLFVERKSTNLYNGIWRIPVDEIERAGSFNAHMFRCTLLLIEQCVQTDDVHGLASIAVQLNKAPDLEKRYVNERERVKLSRQAFEHCFAILRHNVELGSLSRRERVLEDIRSVAQNLIKNNTFVQETYAMINEINAHLLNAAQQSVP